jgi:Cu-Zn family superoxide dismutase
VAGIMLLATMDALGFVLTAPPATAESGKPEAEAHIIGLDHRIIGEAILTHVGGGVSVHLSVHGLTPGVHPVRIHAVANCSDAFAPAGAEWRPAQGTAEAGMAGVPMQGGADLIKVAENGTVDADLFVRGATIKPGPASLMDEDGSSIVIHARAGGRGAAPRDSQDRVACGTIGFMPIDMEMAQNRR